MRGSNLSAADMNREELTERTKNVCTSLCEAGDGFTGNCFRQTSYGDRLSGAQHPLLLIYRATCLSQSKASFVAKLSIVLEETDESAFWLEFITDEKLLKKNLVEPLLKEAEELTAIFASSRKTASTKK